MTCCIEAEGIVIVTEAVKASFTLKLTLKY